MLKNIVKMKSVVCKGDIAIIATSIRLFNLLYQSSSHNSKIESGHHHNIPRNERICENCNSGLVKNEYHFCKFVRNFPD